jgi:outer membrane protein assembly factor BamB
MTATPVLDGDRLYFQFMWGHGAFVVALDKATGKEIWKHVRTSDAQAECKDSYASPILYQDKDRKFLITHGADYVIAHDLNDGHELFRYGGLNSADKYNRTLRFVATPVAVPGLIVVPSAKNGPVLGIAPGASGDIGSASQLLWTRPRNTPDVPSPLIHDGLVYLCRENGNLICMDAKTGEEVYGKTRTHPERYRASPVYADGRIYLTARDGVVTVVKAGRQFEILATNDTEDPMTSSPAISNGRIYLRGFGNLWAIGKQVP